MSKARLQEILTRRLKLRRPRFALRKDGDWYNGHVISDTFKGKSDLERQRMIYDALEAEAGPNAKRRVVGMILACTEDEWDQPLEGMLPERPGRPRGRKKAG